MSTKLSWLGKSISIVTLHKLHQTKFYLMAVILLGVLVFVGCEEFPSYSKLPPIHDNYNYGGIMDTLAGDWELFDVGGGCFGHPEMPDYKEIIRIVGQNQDSSIFYEIWRNGVRIKEGTFILGPCSKMESDRRMFPHIFADDDADIVGLMSIAEDTDNGTIFSIGIADIVSSTYNLYRKIPKGGGYE